MRAATLFIALSINFFVISIHAAHAGCDDFYLPVLANIGISIHAAHAGCDIVVLV